MASINEYLADKGYSLGMANVITGLLFIYIGIILAQFTYIAHNIFMFTGIIGLIIGIIFCSCFNNGEK